MDCIFKILIVLAMGLFAFITFVLAYHKEEIWETIIFKEGDS